MDMNLEEQGAYRNLLDEARLRGGFIPDNEDVLAKACGDPRRWPKLRASMLARFELTPSGWHNLTLDSVIRESDLRSRKQLEYRTRNSHVRDNGPQ
jgi:uncharacterized protein YdaU (DUF1376 family)